MQDWESISGLVPGRNDSQCHYKWSLTQKPLMTKVPWTHEEDVILCDLINKRGPKSWAQIAKLLNAKYPKNNRFGKQCRERWFNHLNPEIKRFLL
jgi:transcriptional activator Myb